MPSLSSPTVRKPRSFSSFSARARFCTVTSGTSSSAPEADFGQHAGGLRAVAGGGDDRLDRKRRRRAQDRADIVRIGDLVEHQHDAFLGQRIDIGRGQGLGLRQQPLVHGVGAEPLVDRVRADDFGGDAGVDILVRQALGGVFGQEQLSDLPFRVGQGGRNRVPAIKNHRPVRGSNPGPGDRSDGRISALFRRVYRRRGGTAVFGRDRSWGACVTEARIWQFGCIKSRF